MADLLRSRNPVLKESAFAGAIPTGETMTIQGTVNKTGLLLLFVVITAAWTWGLAHSENPAAATPLGIGISLFVVIIASLNLIIDFDMIENGARMGAPKYMEWYGAFGLMVTLIWLYMEMLRLLSKVRRR